MAKPSHRTKILTEGLKVMHARGFTGASVRDIVQAAGVPQGSFTNHFASKEAFGLEVVDLYFARGSEVIAATLRNDALPPLQRLAAYIDTNTSRLNEVQMRNGCLFGNFTAEAADASEPIRSRLVEIFAEVQASIAYCLEAAVVARANCLPASRATRLPALWYPRCRAPTCWPRRSAVRLRSSGFKRILFTMILRPTA